MTGTSRPTLLTLNTRTGPKKKPAPVSYSSYWMDFDDDAAFMDHYEMYGDGASKFAEVSDTERVMKLASVRRAIANFVRILTNDGTIGVAFSSGQQSYTDGKKVVISADSDPKKFDSMVGLALHEGSHCLLSDFGFLKNIMPEDKWINAYRAMSAELRSTIPFTKDTMTNQVSFNKQVNAYQRVLGLIMNVIEDRRIDSYIYHTAAGYRPYYDAMYTRYFYNKDIDKNLQYNPEWRTPTVENYITWLINLFNPKFDVNALPGLNKMVAAIDLKNIRRFDFNKPMAEPGNWTYSSTTTPWATSAVTGISFSSPRPPTFDYGTDFLYEYNTMPTLWQTANDVLYMIVQYVSHENMNNQPTDGNATPGMIDIDGTLVDMSSMDGNGLENLDHDMGEKHSLPDGKFDAKKAKKAIDAMKKVMNGDIRRKKLNARDRDEINQLESASASLVESGDKIIGDMTCLVTRNLNRAMMEASWFPFAHTTYDYRTNTSELYKNSASDAAVVAGLRMGQVLAHRLQVRNDPQVTHFTRQDYGRIDRRILAQLGMDIEQVFKRTTIENYKPVMLHLSLDASGSMSGPKWHKTISVATALAYVASKVRSIQTVISIRGSQDIPIVSVVYDSRKDNFQKARTLFPYLAPAGSTPEGLCYKATMELITECVGDYDVYFINFSDGEPGCSIRRRGEWKGYSGMEAVNHTKRQVQAMREAGVKILSYFISDYEYGKKSTSGNTFAQMYGENASYVNVQSAGEVIRTLNTLLLNKSA